MKKVLFSALAVILLLTLAVLGVILVQHGYLTLPTKPVDQTTQRPILTPGPGTSHAAPSNETLTAPSNQTSATVPTIQANGSLVSISLPILTEQDFADNGALIFTYTFQDVVLSLPDHEVAKGITLDLLQRMDSNAAKLSQLREDAYRVYAGQEGWRSYFYTSLYSATRIDEIVLSVFGIEESYGNNEAEVSGTGFTYDLSTGSLLTLADILRDDTGVYTPLKEALLEVLENNAEEFQLYDDYKDIVSKDFAEYITDTGCWYLSDDGLCFLFSPYYIAPHAAGVITATVPYEKLDGILQDIYLPVSQPAGEESISIDKLENIDPENFQFFCDLRNSADGTALVLHTDGVLRNVSIERGTIIAGSVFSSDATVFLANRLSPGDALFLEDGFDSGLQLRLHYSVDAQNFSYIISLDENGSPVLQPV